MELSKIFFDLALVIATVVLAWATFKLAQYTRVLAKLTERLVNIETERDARERQERRRKDLATGLQAAERLQAIQPERFTQRLSNLETIPNRGQI